MINKKPYVLVVDDKAIEINFYNFFLKNASFETDCYTDPQKALSAFNPDLHNIVLLDICMPIIDGFVLASKIKKKDIKKSIPIVFISSLDKNENLRKGIQAGGIEYIQKPVDYTELVAKMMLWIDTQKIITNSEVESSQKERRVKDQKKFIIDTQKDFRQLIHKKKMENHQSTTSNLSVIIDSLKMQLHLLKQNSLSFHDKNIIIKNMEEDLSFRKSTFYKKIQEFELTKAEIKIAVLIKAGLTTREITQVLNLSISTIETYRKKIRYKMKLKNKNIDLFDYFNLPLQNYEL